VAITIPIFSPATELGDVAVGIGSASHPVTTGTMPFRNLAAPMPSAAITSGNASAAATRVGWGTFLSGGVACTEWRGTDSESDSVCSGSANVSGTWTGSGGRTAGVYMITVPRMDEESRVERRVNLVERELLTDGESEGGDGDVASRNCEGAVRSMS